MEFESFNAGALLFVGLNEGETAKVDALLAIIGPAGTDVSDVAKNFTVAGTTKIEEKSAPKTETVKTPVIEKTNTVTKPVKNASGRIFISPLAKRMADEKEINTSQIQGSGENGRIIKRDIENYVPQSTGNAAKFVATGQEDFDEKPNSQMRKAIAKSLSKSKFSAPHYYLNVEFDMENAIAFRTQFNTIPDTRISYNDIIVKACALALRIHPQVNSQWFDDKMQLNNHVHIGVAVAVEDGLVVPVVRFANEQTLPQIGGAVRDYADRAKNKKLTPDEMSGSTFTISNLGMFGIESFTSIINQPNAAILSCLLYTSPSPRD